MLFAHNNGWDELLMVLVPIAVIVALLALARRRVRRDGPLPPDDRPERVQRT